VAGTFQYVPNAGTVLTAGLHPLSVIFTPTNTTLYTMTIASVPLTVEQGDAGNRLGHTCADRLWHATQRDTAERHRAGGRNLRLFASRRNGTERRHTNPYSHFHSGRQRRLHHGDGQRRAYGNNAMTPAITWATPAPQIV